MKIKGTAGNDTINGTSVADQIAGLGGDDVLTGAGGEDHLLDGGAGADVLTDTAGGSDRLSGGANSDRIEVSRDNSGTTGSVKLYGDDGDDSISYASPTSRDNRALLSGGEGDDRIDAQGSATIDGGSGNDTITAHRAYTIYLVDAGDGNDSVSFENYGSTGNRVDLGAGDDRFDSNDCTFKVFGGDGADTFSVFTTEKATISGEGGNDIVNAANTVGKVTIDAGVGDDLVSINTTSYGGANHLVTLGEGRDTLELRADSFRFDATNTITDFTTGNRGDRLDFAPYLTAMADGYDGGDPFAEGFLRLVQQGSSALLQFDSDGDGDAGEWRTLVTFEQARAAAFRSVNFVDGSDPHPSEPVFDGGGAAHHPVAEYHSA